MADAIIADIEGSGIYQIRNLVNGKRYVGSAKCFRKRWAEHRSGLRRSKHPNRKLMRSWAKNGAESFVFEIIEFCALDTLIKREQHWIDSLAPEYNISPTAGNNLGVKYTEETKKKISEAHKGNKYCLGRKLSNATRERISSSNKGKCKGLKRSPSQIEATAKAHRGMKRSDETRKKISEARKGKKISVPRSAEYRKKISERFKGRVLSQEHMAALQAGRAARVYTEDQRCAIAADVKNSYQDGRRVREKTEEHKNKIGQHFAKLTDDQVREIRRLAGVGVSGSDLSKKYDSNPGTISRICRGKTYRWVF